MQDMSGKLDKLGYYIVFDTNILGTYSNSDFENFEFSVQYDQVVQILGKYSLSSKIALCVPEIVMGELIEQRIEAYQEKKQDFVKLQSFIMPDCKVEVDEDFNYEAYISDKIGKFKRNLNNKNVIFLSYPDNSKLEEIIGRSLKKCAPFSGKQKESDKGFKDTILWETITQFTANNKPKIVVLFSKDKIFESPELQKEYTTNHKTGALLICKDISEVERAVREIYKEEYGNVSTEPLSFADMENTKKWIEGEEFRKAVHIFEPFDIDSAGLGKLYEYDKRLREVSGITYDTSVLGKDTFVIDAELLISYKLGEHGVNLSDRVNAEIRLSQDNGNNFTIDSITINR